VAILACGLFFLVGLAGYAVTWRGNRWVIFLLFLSIGFTFGRLSVLQANPAMLEYAGHWVTLEGVVSSEPDLRPDRVYYNLDLTRVVLGKEEHTVAARVLVRTPMPGSVYSYGDLLKVHGLLTRPDEPGNPGAFDYRSYLARRGIGVILMTSGNKDITWLGIGGNPVTRWLLLEKKKILEVHRRTLSPDKAALVNGIVFGTQGEIPRQVWQIFSETGIVHILSVSGMHVGLVLAGVLAVLGLLHVPVLLVAPAASMILVFYALLCGLGPAVTRATLMALLFLWAHRLGRQQDWPTTLAFAALMILLWKPQAVYDIGFQLSFAATWGILYVGPFLDKMLKSFIRWPAWLHVIIWVSLAAQLATLPLVAWYYNIVSPVSLLANIIAAPLTGLILALGAAAGILGLFSTTLAGLINASTSLALDVFLGLTSFIRTLPGAFIYVPAPSILFLPAWYLLLCFGTALYSVQGRSLVESFLVRRRRVAAVAALGTALLLVAWVTQWPGEQRLVIHMIDVGQGESILIQTPAGKNMLVDAGGWSGEFESGQGAGDKVVVPYLRRSGIRRLDVLLITHPHEDHAGGAGAVARAFPVALAVVSPVGQLVQEGPAVAGNAKDPKGVYDEPDYYARLLRYLASRGTSVKTAGAGDLIEMDPKVEIRILAPPRPPLHGTHSDANNGSVVLLLRYGQQTFLLTGDIELEAQQWLLDSGIGLAAEVLKVPHHGSRFLLSDFVGKVKPSVALISVGRHNRFGFPAAKTINLLQESGAKIYQTDRDGATILTADGRELWVKTGRQQ
jgi:competence protein ComEC